MARFAKHVKPQIGQCTKIIFCRLACFAIDNRKQMRNLQPMTLKEHIAKRGWNKSEFARQAGVQPCTAARWVNGTQAMEIAKARELHAKFGIPLSALCPKIWGKA